MFVYVKGEEKKKWLAEILNHNNIINLDDYDATSLKVLQRQRNYNFKRCSLQHNGFCSYQNVYLLDSQVELLFPNC